MTDTNPFAAHPRRPGLPPPEPLDGRRPRILAHVLRAMPQHNAGAERMLHEILEGLVDRGWDALIAAVEHKGEPYRRNGILVRAMTDMEMVDPYAWCDIAVTHLDVTPMAMAWARYGRPLLHLVHNHRQLLHHRVPDDGRNVAVWNSEWICPESGGWHGPQIVCRPPVRPVLHATHVRDRWQLKTCTLVNLLDQKGGPLFWRLAEKMPDWKFVGVTGAYGWQAPAPDLPNVEVVAPTDDLRPVWGRTSVLLAPSWYESFGLAAHEAMASGIPVICHPTPGLEESMTSPEAGRCAMFINRDDDEDWIATLTELAEPASYGSWSDLASLRSHEIGVQAASDLDRLDVFCRQLAASNQGAIVP